MIVWEMLLAVAVLASGRSLDGIDMLCIGPTPWRMRVRIQMGQKS